MGKLDWQIQLVCSCAAVPCVKATVSTAFALENTLCQQLPMYCPVLQATLRIASIAFEKTNNQRDSL